MELKFVLPCHFGMESVLKRELKDLGIEPDLVSDGKVKVSGDESLIPICNTFLRTAERVMIELGEFKATTFEELFESVRALPLLDLIPEDGEFPVTKASSINSKLLSPRDIQAITKKAIVERLKKKYKIGWFNEDGGKYPLRVFIKDDIVSIFLDSTGDSLHKRGYKKRVSKAPISETLAAALIMLTPFKDDRFFLDPFCGTGTLPIEAALIAKNMAPGRNRSFIGEQWDFVSKRLWDMARTQADDEANPDKKINVYAYDKDSGFIGHAKANAALAGVEGSIHFKDCEVADAGKDFYKFRDEYGFIVTNPPYGERLDEENVYPIYKQLGELFRLLPTWSLYVISSYPDTKKAIGGSCKKNRKVYNGMKKTYYYQYPGPAPGKNN